MSTTHQVTCINKSDRTDPHERIASIGGINADSTRWKLGQQEAIEGIENGKWTFYVSSGGTRVNIIVSKSAYGRKYLKTEADTTTSNNLLSLPECP